jgi:hypothetical protein
VVFSSCAINCFLTCQQAPETLYRALATKLIIGMPYKDLATVDTILLNELPAVEDKEAVSACS